MDEISTVREDVEHTTDKQTSKNDQSTLLKEHSPFLVQPTRNRLVWKALYFTLPLLILTVIPTVAYYINYPWIERSPDTISYLLVVERSQVRPDLLVNPVRVPGYPLFIRFVYMLEGRGNLAAVSDLQAVLFILMELEIYLIALLVFRRVWLAFLVGLLVGTNLILVSYIKPIMSEGLAAFLLTTLALTVVCFVLTPRVWKVWPITLLLLLLTFTRPEWVYLPSPLLAYLLLVVIRRRGRRQLVQYGIHAVLSLVLIYLCVGAYIERNGIQNHYQTFTSVVNFNLMGKVLQYGMENEVPLKEKPISRVLDKCIARIGSRSPYQVLRCVPALSAPYGGFAGEFAKSIILNHPAEFFFKSWPLFFSSLTDYFDVPYHQGTHPGPFYTPLSWLKTFHQALYLLNAYFPTCVLVWLFLLCRRQTASWQEGLAMGAITLLLVYGIIITTLGGYTAYDYMRFHIVFYPLLIFAIWGSFLRVLIYPSPSQKTPVL